jgi:uncharacterized protein YbaR (Trm112 family)
VSVEQLHCPVCKKTIFYAEKDSKEGFVLTCFYCGGVIKRSGW